MARSDDDTAPRDAVILLATLLVAGIAALWFVPGAARDTRIAAPAADTAAVSADTLR